MRQRMLAWALVVIQFLLIAAMVFAPRGSLWPVGVPAIVLAVLLAFAAIVLAFFAVTGLGRALTPSPIPREGAGLVTGGAYGLVRHPIYTALLIGGAALLVLGASWWHVLLLLALLVLLMAKARWEERMLLARHPAYRAYAARVGRFVPGVGKVKGPSI